MRPYPPRRTDFVVSRSNYSPARPTGPLNTAYCLLPTRPLPIHRRPASAVGVAEFEVGADPDLLQIARGDDQVVLVDLGVQFNHLPAVIAGETCPPLAVTLGDVVVEDPVAV